MNKHSLKPWTACHSDDPSAVGWEIRDGAGEVVGTAERTPDAHAFAASLDLLDALKVALPAIAMHTRQGARDWPASTPKTESGEPDLERIVGLLRAALAKAEGKKG